MAEEVSRKPYVRAMTSEWIFRHPRYLRYMTREFSLPVHRRLDAADGVGAEAARRGAGSLGRVPRSA